MAGATRRPRGAKPPDESPATAPSEGDAHEGAPETNGEKKAPPAFKVGPIVTAKGECVAGCVWERTFTTPDGRVLSPGRPCYGFNSITMFRSGLSPTVFTMCVTG